MRRNLPDVAGPVQADRECFAKNRSGVCILLTAVNAIFAFVSAAGTKVVYIRSYAEAAGLLPPWIFATLGLPLSLLFFRRTYLGSRASTSPGSSPKGNTTAAESQPPIDHDDSGLASVLSSSQKDPIGNESYPMVALPYAVDAPPISPSSPGSTIESGVGRLADGRRGPGSIDTEDSSSRLWQANTAVASQSDEQPFYSSYAARQPNDVEEIKAENGGGGGSRLARGRK